MEPDVRKIKRNKYRASAHRASMLRTWLNAMQAGDIPAIRAARIRMLQVRMS